MLGFLELFDESKVLGSTVPRSSRGKLGYYNGYSRRNDRRWLFGYFLAMQKVISRKEMIETKKLTYISRTVLTVWILK